MQPKSALELTPIASGLLLRTVRNVIEARRQRLSNAIDLPDTLGIKLTNRCNLRCAHCYQWNEDGYHHRMTGAEQRLDLDVEVFEALLEETRPVKSRLYLWGGEPLVHRDIARILDALANDPRETTICTNAYFIPKHFQALCQISETLELLIAVEGFEAQHDSLRGRGSFSRVMDQVDMLLAQRDAGVFHGKISIHTMINDGMTGRLYELMELFEQKRVDLVMLTFPWYISEATSREMDQFVSEKFSWLVEFGPRGHTWDAFKYHLNPENIDLLLADLRRIEQRTWTTKIRYQPDLEIDEIEPYVRGQSMDVRCAKTCRMLNSRVDVSPTGNVSACKFFSEFSVGNLHSQSLAELWRSGKYHKIRQVFDENLSPACSKCNVLYLPEHSTPLHF